MEQAGGLNAIVALSHGGHRRRVHPAQPGARSSCRAIALITPHAWFLRAIDTMSVPDVAIEAILPSVLVLVAMGLVTGAIGLVRARRTLMPA